MNELALYRIKCLIKGCELEAKGMRKRGPSAAKTLKQYLGVNMPLKDLIPYAKLLVENLEGVPK